VSRRSWWARLDAEVSRRFDRIVAKGLPVVIGDASGPDKAVQRYFMERGFGDPCGLSHRAFARSRNGGSALGQGRARRRGGDGGALRRAVLLAWSFRTHPVQALAHTAWP